MFKRFLLILSLVFATVAFAEPSFDEMQTLISQRQCSAAESGLSQIIKNHPNSAKAYFSMAQAQSCLGNKDKAQYAMTKARGLDPTLKFAPEATVKALESTYLVPTQVQHQVVVPTVAKESTFWRDYGLVLLFTCVIGGVAYYVFQIRPQQKREEEAEKARAEQKAREAARLKEAYDSFNKAETQKHMEFDTNEYQPTPKTIRKSSHNIYPGGGYVAPVPTPAPVTHNHYSNNNNSSNDMLTGVLVGNMISNSGHHDTTRIIERETVVERPSTSSSWGSSSSSSSSWDDDRKSSSSSSWSSSSWDDDDRKSSSSSSWSSSSSSDSSSSWDSGSSSSSSYWD